MPGRFAWFERKFDFDFPAGRYPDMIERLRGTPAHVEERIRACPAAVLTRRIGDTWSIQENVGHLLDLEPLWAGRLDDILAGAEVMPEADLTNRKTHEADHNSASIDALTSAFRTAREYFVARLDALGENRFAASARHPRLQQPMRLADLCLFTADHDDYHLARMTELAR
jgi:uncharacterized damage-inducible protein DinB